MENRKAGKSFPEIAKLLPGRSENSVKNRYHSGERKKKDVDHHSAAANDDDDDDNVSKAQPPKKRRLSAS
jgi:hypothetical protein